MVNRCAICVKIPKSQVIVPMIDLETLKLLTQTTNAATALLSLHVNLREGE